MRKNYLGWIIFGVLGFIAYRKFLLSQSINVFFKNLDFSKLSFTDPTLLLQVQVNNPTSTTADLQNIRGDLYIDGAMVGSVFGITPMVIASGSSIINIPVTLSYLGVADLISKFKTDQFSLEFTGSMVVDFIPIPLNFKYNF
jgi:LEA14-like dessication related protein